MTFGEISELRHQGKLKEALTKAKQDFEKAPENIWAKRSLAWVYSDLLKNATQRNLPQKVLQIIDLINGIKLPHEEKIFFESIAWTLAKYLKQVQNLPFGFTDKLTVAIAIFDFPAPAASYTFLIKTLVKNIEKPETIDFVFYWLNLVKYRKEDFRKTDMPNGKKIISEVEQIFIAVSRLLLKEPVNIPRIEKFLPQLEYLAVSYPQMQYPHYYLAKLLLVIGNKERFFKAFIPFARKKKRDFWVWDLMSEAFEKGDHRRFACLCRSLLCNAPVKFSLNVKEKFAAVLLEKKMFAEAKCEINEVIECREHENWRLTPQLKNWRADENIKDISPVRSNKNLYARYAPEAEKLLYYDIKPDIVVVSRVNHNKKIVYFTASGPKSGSFLYGNFNMEPHPGDFYEVRFAQKRSDKSPNFYHAVTVERMEYIPETGFSQMVSGKIAIGKDNSFGFVNDVFVPPEIVSAGALQNGQPVTVSAVQSFNKKKKKWGWMAVRLIH
jgi:hypothetical protein